MTQKTMDSRFLKGQEGPLLDCKAVPWPWKTGLREVKKKKKRKRKVDELTPGMSVKSVKANNAGVGGRVISLMVQWLRYCIPNARGPGFNP